MSPLLMLLVLFLFLSRLEGFSAYYNSACKSSEKAEEYSTCKVEGSALNTPHLKSLCFDYLLPEISYTGFRQQNCAANLKLTLSAQYCVVWD